MAAPSPAGPDLERFLARMVAVFRAIYRVLRDDGVVWLCVGDGYATERDKQLGLKPRDLRGIPWRLALALQRTGWYLRADVICRLVDATPEHVKDRPTRGHAYVFMLTKFAAYYYDKSKLLDVNGRNLRTVWESTAGDGGFPPQIIARCILGGSPSGATVLEPFCVSSAIAEVCQREGRKHLGIKSQTAERGTRDRSRP